MDEEQKYISTRDKTVSVTAQEAIYNGIDKSGGLYVPLKLPYLDIKSLDTLMRMDYFERAAFILQMFFPDLKHSELRNYCKNIYSNRFGVDPTPIVTADGKCFLELWHGPTHAFKDFALQMLPYFLDKSKTLLNKNEHSLVLTATSGDTGAAAIEGFKGLSDCDVVVFYPSDGVSELQKRQMAACDAENVSVIAIRGNFDDAQNAVKNIFADKEFAKELAGLGCSLTSANSINLGRLIPQIVYYFSAYADLVTYGSIGRGEKINFCVPSGNFGNILAGYYAKKMGLPINKLICASNSNSVLTDFFKSGSYDSNRNFLKTNSPSMDILISSNLERLIFELSGRDCLLTAKRMQALKQSGRYDLTAAEHKTLLEDFDAEFAADDEAAKAAAEIYSISKYFIDPHTAVALSCYNKYLSRTKDISRTVIFSTASPLKFPASVLRAIGQKPRTDEFTNLKLLLKLAAKNIVPCGDEGHANSFPEQRQRADTLSFALLAKRDEAVESKLNAKDLLKLQDAKLCHTRVIDAKDAKSAVLQFCKNRLEK